MARPGQSTKENGQTGSVWPVWPMIKRKCTYQYSRVQPVTAFMPTRRNAGDQKWQHVAAMPTRAIRLTITWQCDMLVHLVGRHSTRPAFRHGASQTSPLETFIYRLFSGQYQQWARDVKARDQEQTQTLTSRDRDVGFTS